MKFYPPEHRKKKLLTQLFWLTPGVLFYALFRLSYLWPGFTEIVYSRGVFRFINQGLSTVTGRLPFSVGEFILYAFVLLVISHFIVMVVHAIMAKKSWWYVLLRRIVALLGGASIVYALFIGLWGINYARRPLGESLNLDTSPATVQELYATCETLIMQANTLRAQVPQNGNGVFTPKETKEDIMKEVSSQYNHAAKLTQLNWLSGNYGRVKPVLFSIGLSYSHINGIYFPFTGEANVNTDMPMLFFASSCYHEAAHQRGFAREDEANFLAYYICSYSDNASVRYSGTMLALVHSMNQLYTSNSDMYFSLRELYSPGLSRDLADNSAYWQGFESAVSETAKEVNNTFLKANMQEDGVKSYGRMVDLMIGLWRAGKLNTGLPHMESVVRMTDLEKQFAIQIGIY